MNKTNYYGADWLQPVGTDCTACDGSPKRQLTLCCKVLALNDAFNTYNLQQQDDHGFSGAYKALFFAKATEGIKAELATYKVNLEERIFEELFSPDFFEVLCNAKWLKGQKLEKVLLSLKGKALITFGIAEEVDGHQTKSADDLYQWLDQNIGEIRALLKAIRKLTFKLPPESFAAVYEKQSLKIDMETILTFYNEKILSVGKLTFRKLQAFRTHAVANFINLGVLKHAFKPTTEEIAEVDFERVKRELPPDYEFKEFFVEHCAIFKKMIIWKGKLLVIDKENYGKYICLHMSKLTDDELLEFFKLEKLLALINEAIMNLPQEDEKDADANHVDLLGGLPSDEMMVAACEQTMIEGLWWAHRSWSVVYRVYQKAGYKGSVTNFVTLAKSWPWTRKLDYIPSEDAISKPLRDGKMLARIDEWMKEGLSDRICRLASRLLEIMGIE